MNKKHTDNYKYHYFYKITNILNGFFYYGIHSTNNLDDGYMGSGSRLKNAIKKYGVENFHKDIIKFFKTRKELSDYESSMVTEDVIRDQMCYNISLGGEQTKMIGSLTAYDIENKKWKRITFEEYDSNPNNYINAPAVGHVAVLNNETHQYVSVPKDEYVKNKYKYSPVGAWEKDDILVVYKSNPLDKPFTIKRNEFDDNIHIRYTKNYFKKDQVTVKDSKGNVLRVNKNDPRYLSGELKHNSYGYKFTEDQKLKLKQIHKERHYQQGIKNSQYGKKWIYKGSDCMKIDKEDLQKYLEDGWQLGCLYNRKH